MNKAQAIDAFWNSFGLPAYDENTVPQNAEMPRITYEFSTGSLGDILSMSASVWYMGTSWREASQKAGEIEKRIGEHGGELIQLENGLVWITKGTPFSVRMSDPNDMVRRIRINTNVEYLTAY